MLILRKFESYSACPKCKSSNSDLLALWCVGGMEHGDCSCLKEGYEHLHMECGRCGFRWYSETADMDEVKKNLKVREEEAKTAKVEADPVELETIHINGEERQ